MTNADEVAVAAVIAALREADTHVCDAARDYTAMARAAIEALAALEPDEA